MSVCVFCVGGGSLGLQRHLSTSSSNHSLVTGCMMELHTPVEQYLISMNSKYHMCTTDKDLLVV